MNKKKKRIRYDFGSWLGENSSDILKTGIGTTLTATGIGAPIGMGLMASGVSGLAANNLTEDPNTKTAIQTTGDIAGMMGGAGLLKFAMGGSMMNQLSEINNGGTHEQNPMGGVPMGQTASVEQGETKWEDYIFSDRLMMPDSKKTFADESKKIQKKYPKERENDKPTQLAKKKEMERLMASQEMIRTEMGMNTNTQMGNGGTIKNTTDSLGRVVYPNEVVSDKAKEYFKNNPSMFYAVGAPKQTTSVYGNKQSIKNSLKKSIPVSENTIESLGIPASTKTADLKAIPKKEPIIWQKEPGIKGWRQANYQGKTIYKKVEEKADGGFLDEIPEIDNSGVRTQDIDSSLYTTLEDYNNPQILNSYEQPIVENVPTTTRKFNSYSNAVNQTNLMSNKNPLPLGVVQPSSTYTPPDFSGGIPNNSPVGTNGVLKNSTDTSTPESSFKEGDTNIVPPTTKGSSGFDKYDALTMGAQLLPAMYNIGQGLRKQTPVNLGRINPRTVDYSASRKVAEDSFDQQANILKEGIRENATSSGQALSNRVAFANRAALDKSNQLGQINEREYNTNQQIRGNADQVNLQIRANEEQIDAQNKGISQTAVGMGLAQVGQAAGTINRDRNLRNTQEETIDMLGEGTDFDLVYDPKLGRRKRVYRNTKNKIV